jgi:hypothetical protein
LLRTWRVLSTWSILAAMASTMFNCMLNCSL